MSTQSSQARRTLDPPGSPPAKRIRQPSWINLRLALGVLLVLASVVVGTKVVAGADRSVRVWALSRDVAGGTVLAEDDVRSVRVRLFDDADRYLLATRSPAGRTVGRDLGAGELLPVSALHGRPAGAVVSLPVSALHVPDNLERGMRIDVYATTHTGQAPAVTRQVLVAVPVQAIRLPRGGLVAAAAEYAILVRVAPRQVAEVVRAVRAADLDVVVAGAGPLTAQPAPSSSGGP